MASITFVLFFSLLSHSILLGKCSEDDDLLKGIQQYRESMNLTVLVVSLQAECIAQDIAETYKNQTCTNPTALNATVLNTTNFPSYSVIMTKCRKNATNDSVDGMILPTCIPPGQQNLSVSNFTSKYAAYLNSTQFSSIGIGSEDNWLVVLASNVTAIAPNGAPGLTLTAMGPAVLSLICLFMLV